MKKKARLRLVGEDPTTIFDDLDQLRADTAAAAAAAGAAPPKPGQKGWRRFYTVVPRGWELRLRGARGVTFQLALELLYQHWRGGGGPIAVSGVTAKAAGVSLRSKTNALIELEQRGLVVVERNPRRSPRVVLLSILV